MNPSTNLLKMAVLILCLAWVASPALGSEDSVLARHMGPMLTGSGQWRTPNPDYSPDVQGPESFGVRLRLTPDGSHVIGDLTGLYPDGREVTYWTLMSFYNPVSDRIIFQQIGWNGALVRGESAPQSGNRHSLDTIEYQPDGRMKLTRHVNTFLDPRTHHSDVFEREGEGWVLKRNWVWTLHADKAPTPATPREGEPGSLIQPHAQALNVGAGSWLAANPAYVAGNGEPTHYGLEYRWGPYQQHAVGELVSIFDDGRSEHNHTLFLTVNPVTQKAYLEQAGRGGVYFRGELGWTDSGRHIQGGLVFLPDGTVRSVRDEVEEVDESTRISHVFERNPNGSWRKAREWTWRPEGRQ